MQKAGQQFMLSETQTYTFHFHQKCNEKKMEWIAPTKARTAALVAKITYKRSVAKMGRTNTDLMGDHENWSPRLTCTPSTLCLSSTLPLLRHCCCLTNKLLLIFSSMYQAVNCKDCRENTICSAVFATGTVTSYGETGWTSERATAVATVQSSTRHASVPRDITHQWFEIHSSIAKKNQSKQGSYVS